MTLHNEANKEDIAKTVIMPGDPLRAKYIAENYLENAKLVNRIRNMYAYTGNYKGKKVTIMAHGMGIPSIGIYATELYKFYDVENIIRIGTAGSLQKDEKIEDIILATHAYSLSSFNRAITGEDNREYESNKILNQRVKETAENLNINIKKGKIISTEIFGPYYDDIKSNQKYDDKNYLAEEMEAFGLFFLAKYFNKKAACILTITDSKYEQRKITSDERQKALDKMILLALESI